MITLEQELQARIFVHKQAVLGGFVQQKFLEDMSEDNKGTQIPHCVIMDRAERFSRQFVQDAMAEGTFNELYEKAWEQLVPIIPDNLNILN